MQPLLATVGPAQPLAEIRFRSVRNLAAHSDLTVGRLLQDARSGTSTFHSAIRTSDPTGSGIELTRISHRGGNSWAPQRI